MMQFQQAPDEFLRHLSDFKPIPGMMDLSPFDAAMRQPGVNIPRVFEYRYGKRFFQFPKDQQEVLAKGASMGLDDAGICRHFRRGLRFCGFLEQQSLDRAGCRVRGGVILRVKGASAESRGLPIFTTGPDDFTLDKDEGGSKIGEARYYQDGCVCVAFRRHGDLEPLDLKL